MVFKLPEPVAALAYANKARLYDLLFDVAAETLSTIAADPRHLGARIGATLVLHTWGSALTHHPHVHGIFPGGGLSPDGERWVACRRGFFLPVRVLSRLFRRRFIEELARLHGAGQLRCCGTLAELADASSFERWLATLQTHEWVVYAKRPFAGPEAVLAYLSRYTHRVAISNRRLVSIDEHGVSFRWKDYRAKGSTRHKTMTLSPAEFMRRFLLHVLPGGFHRIRHYGLLANAGRRRHLVRVRQMLACAPNDLPVTDDTVEPASHPPAFVCPCCGAPMRIIENPGAHACDSCPADQGPRMNTHETEDQRDTDVVAPTPWGHPCAPPENTSSEGLPTCPSRGAFGAEPTTWSSWHEPRKTAQGLFGQTPLIQIPIAVRR